MLDQPFMNSEHVHLLSGQLMERDKHIEELNLLLSGQNVERDKQTELLNSLYKQMVEKDQLIASLNEEVIRRGEWGLGLDRQIQQLQDHLQQITSSKSWKLTFPLREADQWLRYPAPQAKRSMRRIAKRSETLYLRLFIKEKTRYAHKRFLSKYFPGILRAAEIQPFSETIGDVGKVTVFHANAKIAVGDIHLTPSLNPGPSGCSPNGAWTPGRISRLYGGSTHSGPGRRR